MIRDINTRNIYLAGFMGCGKTTTARALSESLGWNYLDTDAAIEYRQRRSIATIFSEQGEEFFRQCEAKMVHDLKYYRSTVVSLGGGMLTQKTHIDILKKSGTLIYLKASVSTILQRIEYAIQTRPILSRDDFRAMPDRIRDLLTVREHDYASCDLTVAVDDMRVEEVVQSILHLLEKKNRRGHDKHA